MINNILTQYIKNNILMRYNASLEMINNEAVIHVSPDKIISLLRNLRDDTNTLFVMLISICGVDTPQEEKRFVVVYNLLSLKLNTRIRIKVSVSEKEEIPSTDNLFDSAGWYERETYDMYGIKFTEHHDLRRILTDYNFKHYPLRKDFPLTGYEEVRYDIETKQVIYEAVKLDQEYRNFDFLSPWEGALDNHPLPGDEKATIKGNS